MPGKEMVERLLLDGVDAEAARSAVGGEHDLAAVAGADEAEPALAVVQLAGARAEVALGAAVIQAVPVFRSDGRFDVHTTLPSAPVVQTWPSALGRESRADADSADDQGQRRLRLPAAAARRAGIYEEGACGCLGFSGFSGSLRGSHASNDLVRGSVVFGNGPGKHWLPEVVTKNPGS